MSRRGDETKARLLDAAERLYGERGIAGVSLREIRLEAKAGNTAAIQFHFGDRDGLLDALIDRHMQHIAALQAATYESIVDDGRAYHRRSLVEVLVRPAVEYLARGQSERAWVKIMAELADRPDLHLKEMQSLTPETGLRAAATLFGEMQRQMAARYARERLIALAQWSLHAAANYARIYDDTSDTRPHLNPEAFIENLVDMTTAALFAPVTSPRTDHAKRN